MFARPGIGRQDVVQSGVGDAVVRVQRIIDDFRDSREADLSGKEALHGDLVGGGQYGRIGAAAVPGLQRQRQAGIAVQLQLREVQRADLLQVESAARDGSGGRSG